MISLVETIRVERPVEECFDYIADFTSTPEWDATAFRARKLTGGPIAKGTEFEVRCRLPLGFIDLHYSVVEYTPPHSIRLEAKSWLFDAVDTVNLQPAAAGTQIDYRADFDYRGAAAALEPALRRGMRRMGRRALEGLARALNDRNEPPAAGLASVVADRLLWPGLALFSTLGYRRGRNRFKPMSASIRGRRIIVTGAGSGLGLATARELARRGADLVLVMRDATRARAVVQELREETGNAAIRYELADLAQMAAVDELASRLLREGRPVDVLVNNAGALFNTWGQTGEGLEQSFALLLLSPWRLTRALLPLLRKANRARVVNVVSGGMYTQKLRVDKLEASPERYAGAAAYAHCKRALTVVTEEWARQWAEDGIAVNAMHPGWADTPGVKSALPGFHRLTRCILRTPQEGADTIVWLAVAREAGAVSGKLFLDREPHTTHLLARTREDPHEREKLLTALARY